jgi:cysteinyl-tRNA synthetase
MDLRLYDTLTKEKRPFVPLDPNNVRMYVCGPTVYDFAHIGNARPVIVFDVLFRLLRHLAKQGVWDGGKGETKVTYVRNITDVDDKINDRAARDFPGLPLNEAIRKVTETTATQFHADAAALGTLSPTFEPRATDFVLPRPDGKTDMVTLIKQLIERGHAYEAGGEVLFDTASMPDYGMLSGRKLDEQRPGARVAVDAHKKSPLDFVLWKQSSEEEPGWESPWGRGRPGWHIECSAMSTAYLDDVFDIHGGGLDLIFPHHENELAQSRCAHGTLLMANFWMHNGFLEVEGKKMSKSEGNFVTIRELLADWPGEVLRLNMLKTHYRSPIDWTVRGLEESEVRLNNWLDFTAERIGSTTGKKMFAQATASLCDDLNVVEVFSQIDEAIRRPNATDTDRYTVHKILKLLGLGTSQSHVAKLARNLNAALGNLPHISANDWRNLSASVSRRPFFGSGKARPGTKAIGSMVVLTKVFDQILPLIRIAEKSPDVQALISLAASKATIEEDDLAKNANRLVALRDAARARKDFDESDRIRNELARMGIVLKDGKDADGKPVTTWEIAP